MLAKSRGEELSMKVSYLGNPFPKKGKTNEYYAKE